jgi:hypothetical protein
MQAVEAVVVVIAVLDNVRPQHMFVGSDVDDGRSDSLPAVGHEMIVVYELLAQSTIPHGSTTACVID